MRPESLDEARVVLNREFHRGLIDRRLFGSFVEHMGRCVYGGIFEPNHPTADEHGFRTDVQALIGELGTTLVRYPGGNFVSGYDWRDGIGPVGERPHRLDLAWRSIESNRVGVDEFLPWARRLGLEPMMAVNLGTGGVADATALVEYCNVPGGTAWSELRRRNGREAPHDIRLWCLGNEMDGEWQIGHKTPVEYGRIAAETARAMRQVDPDLQLVACGSSSREMATFGAWETAVLDHTLDLVDFISMHAYYDGRQSRADFLASGWRMQRFIDDVVATVDAVAARRGSARQIDIAFDEWNVWSSRPDPAPPRNGIASEQPISEDTYQTLDAVVVGDLLSSLLNRCDRVRIGCLSLLVNVSAPIRTERGGPVRRQTIFHPVRLTTELARGHGLEPVVRGPQTSSDRHGDLPALGAAASHDPTTGHVAVFLVNRAAASTPVRVDLQGFGDLRLLASHQIEAPHDVAVESEHPAGRGQDAPVPRTARDLRVEAGGLVRLTVPAHSWTALSLAQVRG